MKRDRRTAGARLTRVTLLLPESLVRHLDLLAAEEGSAKGELIRSALNHFVVEKKPNWDPDREPARVEAVYD